MLRERDTESISGFMYSAAPKCFGKATEVELKSPLALLEGNNPNRKEVLSKKCREMWIFSAWSGRSRTTLGPPGLPSCRWDREEGLDVGAAAEASLPWGQGSAGPGRFSTHSICSPSSHS